MFKGGINIAGPTR